MGARSCFIPSGAFVDTLLHTTGSGGGCKTCTASAEVVSMVMSMGFSKEQAEMGLRNTENSVERAVDWIFRYWTC